MEPGRPERAPSAGRCGATDSGKKNVCLRIVPVVVKGMGQHNTIVANALLDPGSDVTLCDVSLMEKLQVVGRPKEFSLATVNGASDTRKGFELSLSVRGLQMKEEVVLVVFGQWIHCVYLKVVHLLRKILLSGLI